MSDPLADIEAVLCEMELAANNVMWHEERRQQIVRYVADIRKALVASRERAAALPLTENGIDYKSLAYDAAIVVLQLILTAKWCGAPKGSEHGKQYRKAMRDAKIFSKKWAGGRQPADQQE